MFCVMIGSGISYRCGRSWLRVISPLSHLHDTHNGLCSANTRMSAKECVFCVGVQVQRGDLKYTANGVGVVSASICREYKGM